MPYFETPPRRHPALIYGRGPFAGCSDFVMWPGRIRARLNGRENLVCDASCMSWMLKSRWVRLAGLLQGSLGMALLASATVIGLGGWQIYKSRQIDLAEAGVEAANLSHSLAQQAKSSIDAVDLTLHGLVERIEHDGMTDAPRMRRALARRVENLAQVRDIAIIDATGSWLLSAPAVAGPMSSSDRAYFAWHREHAGKALYVGTPIESRVDGRSIVPLTMRFDRPDGSFGGVVRASLRPEYFRHIYEGLGIGNLGIVALGNTSGRLFARVPADPGLIAHDFSNHPLYREHLPRRPAGVFWSRSMTNESWRIAAYEKVGAWPIVVFVAKDLDDVLAGWFREAAVEATILTLAAAMLLGTGYRLTLQQAKVRAADRARLDQAEHLAAARMTAERAREGAECADRAKSDVLATMGEEIRAPLNGVIDLTAAILARSDLQPHLRQQIGLVATSGSALLAAVDGILNYASAGSERASDQASAAPATSSTPRTALHRSCILLAGDCDNDREITLAILDGAGYLVDTVEDGTAAVRAASATRYDVILMSIQSSVLDGLATTRLIRAEGSASRGTPIIALTANISPKHAVSIRAAGIDAHVSAPFDRSELLAVVERFAIVNDAQAA